MAEPHLLFFIFVLSGPYFVLSSAADLGTASRFGPPYLPTACYGGDASQLPADNLFAAASEAIWNGGTACGKKYRITCVAAAASGACVPGQFVDVVIVDRATTLASHPSSDGATFVLSPTAFSAITNASDPVSSATINYQLL